MYPIETEKVYVMKRVYAHDKARARLEKMLGAIKHDEVIELTTKDLNRLVRENRWTQDSNLRTGNYEREGPPTLIFSTFQWKPWKLKLLKLRYPFLASGLFLGQNAFTYRNETNHGLDRCVCQGAHEIHSIYGCLHACSYCHVKDFANIMLNLEDVIDRLPSLFQKNPTQKLFKYDNYTDQPCFEPEYGASKLFVEFFAQQPDKYLLLYTKSDNVDHLLDLQHNDHTFINWSISTQRQSKFIEKETPLPTQRIKAMEKCEKAGYRVRIRFSPIIPLKNWREESAAMIEAVLSKVHPDIITMDVIGFMHPKILLEIIDSEHFDPETEVLLNGLATKKTIWRKLIFPDEFRLEIYKHYIQEIRKWNQTARISICNDNRALWSRLKSEIQMTPENFVCCCGPTSVSAHPLLNTEKRKT